MLRIPCPWCGERDEDEFHCGGEAHLQRPVLTASNEQWADYLFNRTNPKGLHHELWLHRYGCGQWFHAVRHTVTHEFVSVYRLGETPPELTRGDST